MIFHFHLQKLNLCRFSHRFVEHLSQTYKCLNTNIYFYLETPGGQNYNLNLNVVHFINTSVN